MFSLHKSQRERRIVTFSPRLKCHCDYMENFGRVGADGAGIQPELQAEQEKSLPSPFPHFSCRRNRPLLAGKQKLIFINNS